MQRNDSPTDRHRVAVKLEDHVLAFLHHVGVGGRFHGRELTSYVMQRAACASGSPERIFRLLADEKRPPVRVEYEVINRAQSLYQVTALYGPEGKPREEPAQLSLLEAVG